MESEVINSDWECCTVVSHCTLSQRSTIENHWVTLGCTTDIIKTLSTTMAGAGDGSFNWKKKLFLLVILGY